MCTLYSIVCKRPAKIGTPGSAGMLAITRTPATARKQAGTRATAATPTIPGTTVAGRPATVGISGYKIKECQQQQ